MKAFFATQGGGSAWFNYEKQAWVFEEVPEWLEGYSAGDLIPEEWGIGGCVGYDKATQENLAWEEHENPDIGEYMWSDFR